MLSSSLAADAPLVHEMPLAGRRSVSVIVPTYNESDNIAILVDRLAAALAGREFEVLVVDDDSPDRTWEVVERLQVARPWLRVVRRLHRRGLSSAVIDGFAAARGDALAVIDADLQHDERILPDLVDALDHHGIAVGSRYVGGGGVVDWAYTRRVASRLATWLSRRVLGVRLRDPMSGFFAVRRELFDRIAPDLDPRGFKILLEVVHRSREQRLKEVPYIFRPRERGESKLDAGVGWQFLVALYDLRFGRWLPSRFVAYGLVGTTGVAVNLLMLALLTAAGASPRLALVGAILSAMCSNFALNNRFTFRARGGVAALARYLAVCSFGAVINYGVCDLALRLGLSLWLGDLAGIAIATLWNYLMSVRLVWRQE